MVEVVVVVVGGTTEPSRVILACPPAHPAGHETWGQPCIVLHTGYIIP